MPWKKLTAFPRSESVSTEDGTGTVSTSTALLPKKVSLVKSVPRHRVVLNEGSESSDCNVLDHARTPDPVPSPLTDDFSNLLLVYLVPDQTAIPYKKTIYFPVLYVPHQHPMTVSSAL